MIRMATVADLEAASVLVARFSADMGRRFDVAYFCKFWRVILENDLGVIFLLEQEGVIQGVIGGLLGPDSNNGDRIAAETWWYVLPEYRGGFGGGRLYKTLETWAMEQCCVELQMVFLDASMPERLEEFYMRQGYEKIETRYSKKLQKFESQEAA